MRRLLALAAVVAAGLLLESTVLAGLRLAGVRPDVLVLAVVAVAMASGPTSGAASRTTNRRPCWARCQAMASPAWLPPTTTTSNR